MGVNGCIQGAHTFEFATERMDLGGVMEERRRTFMKWKHTRLNAPPVKRACLKTLRLARAQHTRDAVMDD